MNKGGLRLQGIEKTASADLPLVTVVTAVFNGEKHLEQTIRSVLDQTYGNIEYIIIDGGSDDGTIDLIRKYEDRIDYWISEADNSVYEAMNKGIKLAKGSLIGLLNADDFYYDYTLQSVVEKYREGKGDILYGNVCDIMEMENLTLRKERKPDIRIMDKDMGLIHPACFVTKETYHRLGGYDESFRISADYEFMLRTLKAGCEFAYIDKPLTCFRKNGMSHYKCTSIIEGHRAMKMHRTGYHNSLKIRLVKCYIRKFLRKIIYSFAGIFGFRHLLIKRVIKKWNKGV